MHMIRNKLLKVMQFISCIAKINNTLMDNAEGLDIAMPM